MMFFFYGSLHDLELKIDPSRPKSALCISVTSAYGLAMVQNGTALVKMNTELP
jgi:hypothetical protein